ncbi:MAG: twin-arginine translocase TatA/TatE family subunit [Anaerolineae bacterium]
MNFGGLRTTELLIILGIVVFIFGVGRLGKLGEELGKGIRNFRQALSEGEPEEEPSSEPTEEN